MISHLTWYQQAVYANEPTFTLANGLQVDALHKHEVLVDDDHDLAMLCAYGPGRVVVSFRGTASLKKYVQLWGVGGYTNAHAHVDHTNTQQCVHRCSCLA